MRGQGWSTKGKQQAAGTLAHVVWFLRMPASDPLNHDAAKEMRENPALFAKNVVNALKGGRVGSTQFPKNKGKGPFAQV